MSNKELKFLLVVVCAAVSATMGSVCFTVLFSSLAIAAQLQLSKKDN